MLYKGHKKNRTWVQKMCQILIILEKSRTKGVEFSDFFFQIKKHSNCKKCLKTDIPAWDF